MRIFDKFKGRRSRPVPTRLNIGCGYDKRPGYLNIDIDPACSPDLLIRDDDYSGIPRNHFDEVYAKDVLEHIPRSESLGALLDWASWLKLGGSLWLQTTSILGVADQLRREPAFGQQLGWTICLFGNQAHDGDFHHTGFTEVSLRVHLLAAGLDLETLELIDGWLFRVTATKRQTWDGFLDTAELLDVDKFLVCIFSEALGRAPDDLSHRFLSEQLRTGMMTRRQAAKHLFRSDERLLMVAVRAGL